MTCTGVPCVSCVMDVIAPFGDKEPTCADLEKDFCPGMKKCIEGACKDWNC